MNKEEFIELVVNSFNTSEQTAEEAYKLINNEEKKDDK